ncbi:MAG: aldolase [Clostridia bacterium]|nr:aldolase [Clostridia bacterium]
MLKEKIQNKEKMIGMYVQLADISIARIAGLAGYDFVWVDTEHSYMSTETLLGHVLAIKATGTPVIVRVPQDDLTYTKKVLEMGVDGIIFPMVKTATESKRLTDYALYPPYGARGFGPMNAIDYGFANVREYMKTTHNKLGIFIQIEHKDTIENLDEIMQNSDIDGYIFGPNDLSGSYNQLGDVFGDHITNIMKAAIQKLHDNEKYIGIASGGYAEETVRHWSSFGVHMLSAGADFDFLRDGALRNRIALEQIHKS